MPVLVLGSCWSFPVLFPAPAAALLRGAMGVRKQDNGCYGFGFVSARRAKPKLCTRSEGCEKK